MAIVALIRCAIKHSKLSNVLRNTSSIGTCCQNIWLNNNSKCSSELRAHEPIYILVKYLSHVGYLSPIWGIPEVSQIYRYIYISDLFTIHTQYFVRENDIWREWMVCVECLTNLSPFLSISWILEHVILVRDTYFRADSRFPPSQWEAALLCNDDSHWLGTSLETALYSLCIAKKIVLQREEITCMHPYGWRDWCTHTQCQDEMLW